MFTTQAVALPLKQRALRGRRLVVVDIENVVGGAVMAPQQATNARAAVERAASLTAGEQVVIGTSHIGVLATGLGWRGPRIVARSGIDGADLALMEILTQERVEARFDEVVLVSGDGIFTDVVAGLGAAGVAVTVVAGHDRCSKRLRVAAGRTAHLDYHAPQIGDVA